jgi:hypothetical protein
MLLGAGATCVNGHCQPPTCGLSNDQFCGMPGDKTCQDCTMLPGPWKCVNGDCMCPGCYDFHTGVCHPDGGPTNIKRCSIPGGFCQDCTGFGAGCVNGVCCDLVSNLDPNKCCGFIIGNGPNSATCCDGGCIDINTSVCRHGQKPGPPGYKVFC